MHVQFASESDAVISANGTADVEADEREKHAAFVLREMFVQYECVVGCRIVEIVLVVGDFLI